MQQSNKPQNNTFQDANTRPKQNTALSSRACLKIRRMILELTGKHYILYRAHTEEQNREIKRLTVSQFVSLNGIYCGIHPSDYWVLLMKLCRQLTNVCCMIKCRFIDEKQFEHDDLSFKTEKNRGIKWFTSDESCNTEEENTQTASTLAVMMQTL